MPEPTPADPDESFNEAFGRHWVSVFRFALSWTNDWSAAEDLAQDAFVRLWAKRADIDWSKPILPWLLTTTHNLATDRFRRLRRAVLPAGRLTAALDSDARLRWLDVKSAMSRLGAIERSALVLVGVVGLDSGAAAEVLGTTPGAVRAAVSRARRRLAEA